MKAYRRGKLTAVVILGMAVFFWQVAQAGTTLLSGSFNAAEAEFHLGSFAFRAPVDGQLLVNMDNPDGSADGEIVFTNVTTGLRYNDGLFYGTTNYPLFNPQTWPRVRIAQGRIHSLYVLPVLAGWGSCDYDVSYVSRRGTQNTGTNSITITYIRRPLTQAGAELLVSLTSDPFESNSESATFDAGNGGWLLLDLLQSGTGGGNHSVYLNGRGIEYNQVGLPPSVMGIHTAIEVGAGTYNLMIRHEDNAWADNKGVRRTDVYFIPYPFETYYVDADAGGSNDGSSWADAYKYLKNALIGALYGDEIRVAQGIYKPTEYILPPPPPPPPPPPLEDSNGQEISVLAAGRTATFQLLNGVVIKGGYAGFGEPDPNDRNINDYETILSGDIGVTGYSSDNSIHVVTGSDCDSTAVLDGFKIIGGNANGVVGDYYNRCGAGMFNAGGSPTVINCTFSRNSAAQDGGGLYNRQKSSPTVTNCKFIGNSAKYGGGMYHRWDSNSTVTNCIFSGNFAEMYGGGIFNWCATSPTLRNCTFSGNTSPVGNALACNSNQQQYPSNVQLTNCVLWDGYNEIVNRDSSIILITYSDVQGGYPGEGNIDADPRFVVPEYLGPMACWKLDETGGTKAYDSIGSNHGNVYGALWATGLVDGALSFDGLNDYVSIPENSELNNLNEISLEAWIYPRRDSHWHILDKGDGDKRIYAEGTTLTLDGRVRYTGEHAFARSVSHTLTLNNWQHVVLTWSGLDNITRLYRNGFEVHYAIRTIGTGDVLDDRSYLWTIGARGALGEVTFFDGLIDEAAIYDRVLSPEEIRENYLAGLSGQGHPDIVMPDYHLLEGSPCINTGDPDYIPETGETDLDGKPRVIAGRIDMGAYELNHAPVADAGPDQTVEAQAHWGATVMLDGSGSSDADSTPGTIDDITDFNWYLLDPCDPNADVLLGSGRIIDCNLPIGEHIIVLEVIDRAGASDTSEVTIIVHDTTPTEFTNIPQDLTVECDGNYNVVELNVWLASAAAVDQCGDVTITNDFVGLLNGCGATGSATVTCQRGIQELRQQDS